MYNMDLSIGSYKCRVEICLLIIIISWILLGHLVCSCSRVGMKEGFALGKMLVMGKQRFKNKYKNKNKQREGFKNASAGFNFSDSNTDTYYKDPSTWGNTTQYSGGAVSANSGMGNINNRPQQPIPLPKDELVLFSTTDFKPECCPNTYSTGSGCACMTVDQYKYLKNRGSNNVPFSEY
jgi:hypothetical protein